MTRVPFGALRDIRVIDLTQMLAGPYGAMVLADHGAQVIKVEPIGRSDGTPSGESQPRGPYFQSINRNKESVSLDLKSPEGREALKALVRNADVVIENFRAGVMERLGIGYEVLREVNPRLVYGCLRGFGDHRTGASPYRDWPAFDVVAQAMGGIMAITGPDPMTPTKIGPGVGDIVPGIMLAFGVLAAVHHARRTGEGQFVDVSMVDSILAVCERMVWQHSSEGAVPGPEGNHHPFIAPFGIFPAADGFVTIAAHQENVFEAMCQQLGAHELLADPRFADRSARTVNRHALIEMLGTITAQLTKAEIAARLGGRVPFGPVLAIDEIEADPHFAAREMIVGIQQPEGGSLRIAGVPIKMTATPGQVRHRAPVLGQDTVARLREAGLTETEIRGLIERRIAHASTPSFPPPELTP
jgi:crotonobetainyl-CoA:carnitine CoA-transferase CaiB-like acyl-CoA transferase